MSDRAIPRSYATMQGLAYTASGWSMRRQIRILQISLEPDGRYTLAGVGRGGQDFGRGPGLSPPRFAGADCIGRLPGVGIWRTGPHRGTSRAVQFRYPRRDQADPGRTGAGAKRWHTKQFSKRASPRAAAKGSGPSCRATLRAVAVSKDIAVALLPLPPTLGSVLHFSRLQIPTIRFHTAFETFPSVALPNFYQRFT